MGLDTKLYLLDENGEKYMGIGVMWLLDEIGKGKSLRAAAQSMGLSYSKAYGMVSRLEKTVGHPMVERKRGGVSHDGVSLTAFAVRYVELYREFQAKAKAAAEKEFIVYDAKVKALMEEKNEEV